ncbi:gluconokinase [Corynebacterium breve]|uniref:Gluconokinase n=1 Tax=Corynebacterium breve TaxID=3049799 RepID=A0ABY8VI45_9CORY|nr:gluconokinase [Corynebacterium breve]WIM67235.1 gluconokinase [Corynebacterium breve]
MDKKIIVMGVSGSGKSTIGEMLGEALDLPYKDGDDLHPQANIDKMAEGIPLNDEDRWPWLQLIGEWLEARPEGAILGCSSLKRSYRDKIRESAPDAVFVHVHGDRDLLYSRMSERPGHFMPASLLDSQLETLEPLQDDESGRVFDIANSPQDIVDDAATWLRNL